MRHAVILGGTVPFREAVAARLRARGWQTDTDAEIERGHSGRIEHADVVVRVCRDEQDWSEFEVLAASDHLGVVAVIEHLDLAAYRRALSAGAGVVFHDTSTEIIVQVIECALHGEALLPMTVARQLAGRSTVADDGAIALDPLERALLGGIADGETIATLGERFHFSDRTIRRRLQSAYLKLGVQDRAGAIRRVQREHLLDD